MWLGVDQRRWLLTPGKVVYGGTEYGKKLAVHKNFMGWIAEMEKKYKTAVICRELVDQTRDYLCANIHGSGYDDHYIVAILMVSGCRLVSSLDEGLSKLMKECYSQPAVSSIKENCSCSKKLHLPRVYKNKKHAASLLSKKYIVKLEHTI